METKNDTLPPLLRAFSVWSLRPYHKEDIIKIILASGIMGYAVNLMIVLFGYTARSIPLLEKGKPVVFHGRSPSAGPCPTSIVIRAWDHRPAGRPGGPPLPQVSGPTTSQIRRLRDDSPLLSCHSLVCSLSASPFWLERRSRAALISPLSRRPLAGAIRLCRHRIPR